jgi:3,4-dihydroxy 2-butanone 4-phosphate synthase/GTP cyclohydrolase II
VTPAELLGRADDMAGALRHCGVVLITDMIRDIGVVGMAGRRTTAENVNFLIRHCRGIVYAAAPREQLDRLRIGHRHGADVLRSRVYVAVDAVANVITGVSAADRAATIRTIIDPETTRAVLRTPGHVLPSATDTTGRFEHFYISEALQYLTSLAGLGDGVALSAVLAPNGSMATVHELAGFAAEHGVPCLDFTDVLRARRLLDRWDTPRPAGRRDVTVALAQLRVELAITAVGAYQQHGCYPVEVLPFCVAELAAAESAPLNPPEPSLARCLS